jgi:hypothetical protein
MKRCFIDGCEKESKAAGMCSMHYKRKYRTGNTETTARLRGTGTVTRFGYVAVANDGKKKQVHRIHAEIALGRPLPKGAEVHHVNENKADNRNENLVICPSKAYHKLIHARMAALDACGNASFRKCPFCKKYDDTSFMTHSKHGRHFYHSICKTEYSRSKNNVK